MKKNRLLTILILSIWVSGCAPLRPVTTIENSTIEKYKYIYISPTNSLTSSSGATYGGQYYSSSKTVTANCERMTNSIICKS